jgi:hypothetical protein
MSCDYEFFGRGKHKVTWKDVLSTPGITEEKTKDTTKTDRCLKYRTDQSTDYLWAYGGSSTKYVRYFIRYGRNDVEEMVNQIAIHTGVKIVSEHGDKYPEDEEVMQAAKKRRQAFEKLMQ